MATLLLRLGAPLMAWGASSLYDRRDTGAFPTKSGVIGLLAAALGRRRDASVEDLNALRFGVRMDLPGRRLRDFQITDMGEKLNKNVSERIYLSDALFLVGLSSDNEGFLAEMEEALCHPRYALFLGRRSCPPTMPLNLGIRQAALEEALREEEWLVPQWRRPECFQYSDTFRLRIITDADYDEEDIAFQRDLPESFSPFKRQYRYRPVKERAAVVLTRSAAEGSDGSDDGKGVPAGNGAQPDVRRIAHDPMKELE